MISLRSRVGVVNTVPAGNKLMLARVTGSKLLQALDFAYYLDSHR